MPAAVPTEPCSQPSLLANATVARRASARAPASAAMSEPDIGYYSPPSAPSIEGICSLRILEKCAAIAADKGFRINNIDGTLIAEAPRVMKHAPEMKPHFAAALGITPGQVGVKATTNERMGFVGREEGIAAMAVACLEQD